MERRNIAERIFVSANQESENSKNKLKEIHTRTHTQSLKSLRRKISDAKEQVAYPPCVQRLTGNNCFLI